MKKTPIYQYLLAQNGMSLLETIGVVSIGAVLATITLPHVHDLIANSKAESLASAVNVYQQAISRYYADVGALLPLNNQGVPHRESTGDSAKPDSLPARLTLVAGDPQVGSSNFWPKFHGPYLEKFDSHNPPELGDKMFMPTVAAIPLGAVVTESNNAWDLKGNNARSDIPTNANVVALHVTGLSQDQFLRFDRIIEPDIGATPEEKQVRGRAKYDSIHRTLRLYLAHQ